MKSELLHQLHANYSLISSTGINQMTYMCHPLSHFSRLMRKPTICIGENKGADQLRGNREADQRLCFRYTDSTIPLLSKSKISILQPSSVTVQTSLCRTWSEPKLLVFSRTGLYVIYVHENIIMTEILVIRTTDTHGRKILLLSHSST